MKALLPAMLLLAACAAAPLPPAPAAASVSGQVVAAPCRPVERVGDPPCPAVGGVTVLFGSTSTTTDSGGNYRLSLPPGTYAIKVRAGALERPATPATITLPAGASVVLNLTYDSGIR